MKVTIIAVMAAVLLSADAGVMAQAQPPQDRINTALARARDVGIPVALLESKVAEGKAKGVSLDRIAAAVERREAALERANQVLRGRPEVGPADLSVAADALESGVSDAVLRAIADTAPRDRRAVAIATLTQLVELGQVPEVALERVREALKRGPDALTNLPGESGRGRGNANGQQDTQGQGRGRGNGNQTPGPPEAVPAPGGSSQPARPGGPPADRGGGQGTGQARGRGQN